MSAETDLRRILEAAQKVDLETLGGNCAECHGLGQDDNAHFWCSDCAGDGWIGLGSVFAPVLGTFSAQPGISKGR